MNVMLRYFQRATPALVLVCLLLMFWAATPGVLSVAESANRHTGAAIQTGSSPGASAQEGQAARERAERKNGSFFGFDDEQKGTMGWTHSSDPQNAAVIRVSRSSSEKRPGGQGSLKIDIDLNSENPAKRSGEAFVNVMLDPPGGEPDVAGEPLDLANQTLKCYVRFSPDFPVGPENPHGAQLFLKDLKGRNFYGCWTNIETTTKWMIITLNLKTPVSPPCGPEESVLDRGFDVSRIRVIGIKIGANPNAPTKYTGSCFLDDLSWDQ